MSYQNQHSLSQPYWNFLPFPSNFLPTRNLSHCCFCFHSTDLQQYNQKCFLSERRKWKAKHFFHKTKELTIPINNKKANSFECLKFLFETYEVCLNLTPIDTETVSTNFILSFNPKEKKYTTLEISSFLRKGPESLLKYELALPQMILSSFHCHFKVCFSKATMSWRLNLFFASCGQVPLQISDWHEKFHCNKKVKPFCFLQKECF